MSAEHGGDLFVHGGEVVSPSGVRRADVLVEQGRIVAVGRDLSPPRSAVPLDARDRLVFPGLIDPQVHFREPGLEHKEDLGSGSRAAIAGGVTTFFEMPNTKPPTTDPAALADKLARAREKCFADHAFFLGATPQNADRLGEWEGLAGCAGIKVFMGSSTGDLLVAEDADVARVLRSGHRRVAVHSEDEPRLRERYAALRPGTSVSEHPHVRDVECARRSSERLLDLVARTKRKVHLLHVSTAEEMELLAERGLGELVTCEVTPNHLFLEAPQCYEEHGARAQMNPPVRDRRHRDALRAALAEGRIDCIGSDHAPHTATEKSRPYPESPSGIPGVQTILPLLLTAVHDGWLSLPDVVRVTAAAPARVYGLLGKGALEAGYDGDLVIVDPTSTSPLTLAELESRAGWSPYVGRPLAGRPLVTVLRGEVVWSQGEFVGPPRGRAVRFAASVG